MPRKWRCDNVCSARRVPEGLAVSSGRHAPERGVCPVGRARSMVGRDERSSAMKMRRLLYLGVAVIAIAVIWAGAGTLSAQQGVGGAVKIDGSAIGGVVSGPSGPEAGVWVIAETTDL